MNPLVADVGVLANKHGAVLRPMVMYKYGSMMHAEARYMHLHPPAPLMLAGRQHRPKKQRLIKSPYRWC